MSKEITAQKVVHRTFTMMKSNFTRKLSIVAASCLFLAASCAPAVAGESKESAVFVAPSPEMVDVSHGPGMPFGGIGTGFSTFGKYGFVDVYFDGRALNGSDWRIDRAPRDKPSFAFQLTEGDKSTVLQETSVGWLSSAKPVDKVRAYADLPKGHFVFEKADSNLALVATAFSPMAPHDLANSTIPVQVFNVTVENKADKDRSFELALLHRDALVVRNNKAVLVNTGGETAFACDHGVASTHGVTASLKLPPGKRQTVRFYIAWNYPSVKTTSSAAPPDVSALLHKALSERGTGHRPGDEIRQRMVGGNRPLARRL